MGQRHTTLKLNKEEVKALQTIASQWGYMQTRGAAAGQLGNISALMRAIVAGELQLVASAGHNLSAKKPDT